MASSGLPESAAVAEPRWDLQRDAYKQQKHKSMFLLVDLEFCGHLKYLSPFEQTHCWKIRWSFAAPGVKLWVSV